MYMYHTKGAAVQIHFWFVLLERAPKRRGILSFTPNKLHLCPVIWALAGGPWPLFCVSWVFFPKVDPVSELGSKLAAPETSGLDPAYSFSGAAIQSTAN